MFKRAILMAGLLTGVCLSSIAGPVVMQPAAKSGTALQPAYDPLQHWEFDIESGVIWRVGHDATPLNYTVLVEELTFKSPPVFDIKVGGGDLVLRNRLSILIEPIVVGPEELRDLGDARARTAKEALGKAGVPGERMFIVAAAEPAADSAEARRGPRVDFTLK